MQSVARPFLELRRFISCSKVTSTRAPEAPIGWPIAMAPPLTLTLRGIPAEILVDRATLRGKGLVGFQIEIVVCFQPAFFSAEREAGTGDRAAFSSSSRSACAFGQDMAPLCLPDKRTARHNRAEKFPKASGPNRR